MLKTFLILINLQIFLYAANQIVLVVSEKEDSSKAILRCFEGNKQIFKDIDVNLGKYGLAWGISNISLSHDKNEPQKREGDKKAPLGIFHLTSVFGYASKIKTKMPYIYATKDLICVDDSTHQNYNQIITMPTKKPKSFEYMRRDDAQYKLGIVVEHNKGQKVQGGSCIFLHVQKHPDAPTAGCTSMRYEEIKKIVGWLDKKKNPILIQVPKKYLDALKKLYPELPLD